MEITRLRKGAAKKRRTRSFFQVQSKKHADDQNISRKKPTPSECNEISPIGDLGRVFLNLFYFAGNLAPKSVKSHLVAAVGYARRQRADSWTGVTSATSRTRKQPQAL